MSVSKWAYTEACDRGICVGDCDLCDKEVPTFGKWIPVDERLPRTGEKVLCCLETPNVYFKFVTIGFYDDEWCVITSNASVIAWMPLPEPYGGAE